MRRWVLAAFLALGLVLGASSPSPAEATNWSTGFHWPRWYGTGSTSTETRVYFVANQNHIARHQLAYVNWAAYRWSASPAVLAIPITATRCPVNSAGVRYNCVVFQTGSNGGGLTSISVGSNRHLLSAVVTLDWNVGLGTDVAQDRNIACHEGGHALGGGFENPAIAGSEHYVCNGSGYPTAHDYADLAGAYNHHG